MFERGRAPLQGDPLGVNMWVAPIVVEAAARVGDIAAGGT